LGNDSQFLQRAAKLALEAAVYAIRHIILSVHLSDRHTPALCQTEGKQKDAVFNIGQPSVSSFLTPRMVDGGRPLSR